MLQVDCEKNKEGVIPLLLETRGVALKATHFDRTHFGRGHFAQVARLELLHRPGAAVRAQQAEAVRRQTESPRVQRVVAICRVEREAAFQITPVHFHVNIQCTCVFQGRRVAHEGNVAAALHQALESAFEAGKHFFRWLR